MKLVWIVLLITLVYKLAVIYLLPAQYFYDELVVTQISQQPLAQLLDSTLAEPHPPGFYLLLKIITPHFTAPEVRGILTLVNTLLLIIVCRYHQKTITKLKLAPGIALFLCSYTFLSTTILVKQNTLSLPLLLFVTLSSLEMYKSRVVTTTTLLLTHLSQGLLLLLGYIYYLSGISILALGHLHMAKKKWGLVVIQAIVAIIYMTGWGYHQLVNNQTRFSWVEEHSSSLAGLTLAHISGDRHHLFTDIHLVVLGLLLVLAYRTHIGNFQTFYQRHFLGVAWVVTLVVLLLVTKSLILIRYATMPLLLLSFTAGLGLAQIRHKGIIVGILVISLYNSMSSLTLDYQKLKTETPSLVALLNQSTSPLHYGVLSDPILLPLELKLNGLDTTSFTPVSAYHPHFLKNSNTITKKHLLLEGEAHYQNPDEVKLLLAQNQLSNYYFIMKMSSSAQWYNHAPQMVLEQICQNQAYVATTWQYVIFKYENCDFN